MLQPAMSRRYPGRVFCQTFVFACLLLLQPRCAYAADGGYEAGAWAKPMPTDPTFAITFTADTLKESFPAVFSSLTIALTSIPSDTVYVIADPGSQLNIAGGWGIPDTLMFTPYPAALNPQEIKVKPWNDAVYEGWHTGTLTFSVVSDDPVYDGGMIDAVEYVIEDNDLPPGINSLIPLDTMLEEGLPGVDLALSLTSIPADTVYITVDPDDQLRITGIPGEPVTLVFAPDATCLSFDYVSVRAVDDALYEGLHTGTVQFIVSTSDTIYADFTVADATWAITDNDNAPGILFSVPDVLALTEGETEELPVIIALQSVPADTVYIYVDPDDQLRVSEPGVAVALVFPPNTSALNDHVANIKVFDDYIYEGPHTGTVTFSIVTSDADYAAFTLDPVVVDIADNDALPAIIFSDTSGFAGTEGDSILQFTVRFGSAPLSTITMSLQPDLNLDLGKGPGDEVKLKFKSDSALIDKVVDVFITDDVIVEGSHYGYITITLIGDDTNYTYMSVPDIRVAITDNDVVSIAQLDPLVFSIYPSPAADRITYTAPTGCMLRIYSAAGALQHAAETTAENGMLDISTWPPGMYQAVLQQGRSLWSFSFVKL